VNHILRTIKEFHQMKTFKRNHLVDQRYITSMREINFPLNPL
jgi:hypothetical protein